MCRWFAYISPDEPCLLEDVLITPTHSLTRQVNERYLPKLLAHDPNRSTNKHEINVRNALLNIDGLGVAWYTPAQNDFVKTVNGLRPALYKTISPPLNDINFRGLCSNTATKVCFAHIRAASATATTPVNNHPFTFGRHSFMHNGVVSDFTTIRRPLSTKISDSAFANILGSTDSEHLAALYMTYLCEAFAGTGAGAAAWEEEYTLEQMYTALHRAVMTVMGVQQEILGRERAPANSLNLAVTDGKKLVAFRFRNHAIEVPPSLYYSTKAGVTLNRKYPDHPDDGVDNPAPVRAAELHGRHVIVASEPSTYIEKDWTLVERNSAVLVEEDGELRLMEIEYDGERWDGRS